MAPHRIGAHDRAWSCNVVPLGPFFCPSALRPVSRCPCCSGPVAAAGEGERRVQGQFEGLAEAVDVPLQPCGAADPGAWACRWQRREVSERGCPGLVKLPRRLLPARARPMAAARDLAGLAVVRGRGAASCLSLRWLIEAFLAQAFRPEGVRSEALAIRGPGDQMPWRSEGRASQSCAWSSRDGPTLRWPSRRRHTAKVRDQQRPPALAGSLPARLRWPRTQPTQRSR